MFGRCACSKRKIEEMRPPRADRKMTIVARNDHHRSFGRGFEIRGLEGTRNSIGAFHCSAYSGTDFSVAESRNPRSTSGSSGNSVAINDTPNVYFTAILVP